MDYRSYRYITENQQNMYTLLRLLTIQEQNYRQILTNGQPDRRNLTDQLIFLSPSTPSMTKSVYYIFLAINR